METNKVGDIINVQEIVKHCRVMYLPDLMAVLKYNINIFWSWGAHNFTVDNQKNCRMFRMNVQGHHHKGHVYIFLNGLDLFDVYLTTSHGKIKTVVSGLQNDQLVEWIDEKVEKIAEYEY